MLVISRKLGQRFVIGKDIVVTIVEIDRGKVRVGVTAPRDVPVYREELLPLISESQPPANGKAAS